MKKYFFGTILLLVNLIASAQTTFYNAIDIGNKADDGVKVVEVEDGYLILAASECFDDNILCATLIKTDRNGTLIWKNQYDLAPNNLSLSPESLLVDEERIMIAGNSDRSGTEKIYLMVLDKKGSVLWSKHYDDMSRTVARGILKTQDGNYVLYGFRHITGQSSEMLMLKIDPLGNNIMGTGIWPGIQIS